MNKIQDKIREILNNRPIADGRHLWSEIEEMHREQQVKELSQLITPQEETEKVMLRKIVSASNSILENKEADWRFGFDNCGNLVVIPKRKQ